ncbi:hypothetical protein D1007_03409 [Hordeum vulgare]|nr:hypothetical protein D1007_03409 [Hordeum vulgare]
MYGSGWRKFYADNKLGKGQLMYFFLDEPSPRATICYIQYNNGSEDEETTEVNDEESIEEDDEGSEGDDDEDDDDGDVPHNIDEVIVRTRGLELTAIEETQLQSLVPLDNSFVGLPFVHRFTRTDVLAGIMKIPKIVAAAAPFEEQGIVGVSWTVEISEEYHITLQTMVALFLAARSGKSLQLADNSMSTWLFLLASRTARGRTSTLW